MKQKSRITSFILAFATILGLLPLSVAAACSHSSTHTEYQAENANDHSYCAVCDSCGEKLYGWAYSGWGTHDFSVDGRCMTCGYESVCTHSSTHTEYRAENANDHSYYAVCDNCGEELYGWAYSGWGTHDLNVYGRCMTCGYDAGCPHGSTHTEYQAENANEHSYYAVCDYCDEELYGWQYSGWGSHSFRGNTCRNCGYTKEDAPHSHSWSYGSWSSSDSSTHERTKSCDCGESSTESASHSFSGNKCTVCGYESKPLVKASVSLSASSSNGSLGSAGGEISSETLPASYSVSASAVGCTVTRIVYDMDGTTYTSYGDSVTITANSASDFTSTTFTAYTDVSGVTATFTVNHKFVKKNSAYIMWETSHDAVIRSITGNGLNMSLAYSMTIPNSYDSQSNLTDSQVSEIQSLIGRSDGKTYTVNYTRTINVYTPAQYSSTGQKQYHASYDGGSSSEIADCISRWGWTSGTAEAIRQAANSSLAFTTSLPVDCTAVWINTANGAQLHSTKFGNGVVTSSNSTVVSVAYGDYADSGKYVFESLAYSGDFNGTSTNSSFSQVYTATSKPVTVTFYCHPLVTDGDITVTAIDGDTGAVIPSATVTCGGSSGANPSTFAKLKLGTYAVSASASGYSSASDSVTLTASANKQSVTLKLYKTVGNITVNVIDAATSQPISGASVSGAAVSGTTDVNGSVSFGNIVFGTHTFTASASGYYPNSGDATISRTKLSTSVTIPLTPIPTMGNITVTVTDASTGRVISGASVSGASQSGSTDSSGSVSFSNVPFGSYSFSASASGYYSNSGTATISLSNMTDSITIPLTPIPTKGDITVTVIDSSTGAPISGASVSGAGRSGSTDSRGSIFFSNVLFGSYSFSATATGYYGNSGSASISLSSMTDSIIIALDPIPTSGDITVYVRDKDSGAVISGATVSGDGITKTTDSSGCVVFADLDFATYTFTASAFEYHSASANATISERRTDVTITIYLEKMKTDLTIRAICNGTIFKGSTIMVTAEVFNNGEIEFTPSRPATVSFTAKRNGIEVFDTQSKTIIIPKNERNLVWFEVDIPESGFSSNNLIFEVTVTPPRGVIEINSSNNTDSLTKPVQALPDRDCADNGLETVKPTSFSYSRYNTTDCPMLNWTVYEWNGGFVRKTYTAALDMDAALIPNANAGYRVKQNGVWTTRSGYGVDTSVDATVSTSSLDIVGELKVDAFFPEHNYSTAAKKSDRLELDGRKFAFKVNPTSVNGQRLHTVPLWFPDGAYAVKYYAFDVWCPAGMLTGYTNAHVNIDGDMYDDLYTG